MTIQDTTREISLLHRRKQKKGAGRSLRANLTLRTIICALPVIAAGPAFASDAQTPAQRSFQACEDAHIDSSLEGSLCTKVQTPLDYADLDNEKVDLFIRKFPASKPAKGQLWLIAGGPGESGASFYPFLETIRATAPDFDLMIPDHRGTGYSTRLCREEESAESPNGTSLAGAEWGSCFGELNADVERTHAFSISNAARDLNFLMDRFDTEKSRYVYGVSYGTQLVLRTMAIAPPENVDGIILDSLVPPEDSTVWDLSHRSAIVDNVGRQILRDCEEQPECREAFSDTLEDDMQGLLEDPAMKDVLGPNPKYVFSAFLDIPETRNLIPSIIADLRAGNPESLEKAKTELTKLGEKFGAYPQAPSSIPLVSLISRSENTARPELTAEDVGREEEDYLFASPLSLQLLQGGFPTYEKDGSFASSPKHLPPTLVLHGGLDPKTPYEGAVEHVALIESAGPVQFVTVERGPHFIMMTAPNCYEKTVQHFMAQGVGENTSCELVVSP